MTPAVEVEDLTLSYGGAPVLAGVTFRVAPGEFFIVIGPNGSGKTSLMKALAGIERPRGGRIRILGRPLESYGRKALARKMALVPQNPAVDFPFTVAETVAMGRAPHQGALGLEGEEDAEVVRRALDFTGVGELAGRKIEHLSGGERQRVFVARAICQEPEVILLDEPTAALDLAHQARLMDLMEDLKRERGVTVVMVSHDVNLAALYADRLLLLKKGAVVSQGRPGEVLTYDTLESAYDCTLLVDRSPLGDFPRVTLVPGKFNPSG